MTADKVRENRLRRTADRHGYRLSKSPRRDPQALDYDLFALLDVRTGGAVNPAIADRWVHSWSLDDVEAFLVRGHATEERRRDVKIRPHSRQRPRTDAEREAALRAGALSANAMGSVFDRRINGRTGRRKT